MAKNRKKPTPGKRSPTAHRTPEQIREHGRTYQATEAQKKARAKRNQARKKMEDAGRVSKGDGKDVNHKTPISRGGGNTGSNLSVTTRKKNRGHGMSPGGTKPRTRKKP